MRVIKLAIAATATTILVATYPDQTSAQGFTGAQFLERSVDAQGAYIDVAVQMAGFVAAQNNGPQAKCIDDWYLVGNGTRDRRVKEITAAMRANPTYHPGAVVIAVLQKACGSFKYVR